MLFLRLGLRLVSARPACRLRRYANAAGEAELIKRVAPEATVGVREAVLWPGRPDMCRLAEDAQGLHLAANVNNDVVGVVSLFVDGAEARFRKFAVLEAHRGAGVGSRLLQAAEAEAASAGAAHINCDARADTAAAYYEKRGYTAAGPPFAKYADSEQLYATMRKPLA